MPQCPIHNLEAQWKTGYSNKTGKNYAFWSCPVKKDENNGEFCRNKFTDPAPDNAPQAPQTAPQPPETASTGLLLQKLDTFNAFQDRQCNLLTDILTELRKPNTSDIPFGN